MKFARKIELLSPAGNLESGIEAINHGADAVYIGIDGFSARSAAGNSVEDIRKLCEYAHPFFVKVYVALNIILFNDEIKKVEKIIWELYEAGADALIIQDMGILRLNLPPIPLHASTQTDNRTIEKINFLEKAGFSQVVLARELSLEEIREIAGHTSLTLEAFIHGALCVSYSGRCYISQAITGRSANRGKCAQLCRLPYTLQDAKGKTIVSSKHLLSLKDLNQTGNLEKLLDAGISSLKIEGRLKETSYVKNITAHYRKHLDEIFTQRPEFVKASSGSVRLYFTPDPSKSFNRGFTDYFLNGRNKEMYSGDSPKFTGEKIGTLQDIQGKSFTLAEKNVSLSHGDGLCFFDAGGKLTGLKINRIEGNKIYPAIMPRLHPNCTFYRNYDHEFEKILSKRSAERKISLDFLLEEIPDGFRLTATDEDGFEASSGIILRKEKAIKSQAENIRVQLSKLGNTVFALRELKIQTDSEWFIPLSVLSELKREVGEKLVSLRLENRPQPVLPESDRKYPYPEKSLSYTANISNYKAEEFYNVHGVESSLPAFELKKESGVPWMFNRYCIKYQFNLCPKQKDNKANLYREPLYLLTNQTRLRLVFNCNKCEMMVKEDTF